MAYQSDIYNEGDKLYYKTAADASPTYIQNPGDLQKLAQAGKVKVGTPYIPLAQSGTGSPAAPGAPQTLPTSFPAPGGAGGAPTPGAPGGAGSATAFNMAFGQIMGRAQQFQGLQDQRNKILQQMYDRPLTPEELRTLSPAQQEAIRAGDRSLLEFQVMSINDMIKGRADENTKALTYMLDGYKQDQADLKAKQIEADKRRDDARQTLLGLIDKYGDISGLGEEAIARIQQTGEITPADAIKLSKTLKEKQLDLKSRTPVRIGTDENGHPIYGYAGGGAVGGGGGSSGGNYSGDGEIPESAVTGYSAKDIAASIKQHESGGNYSAKGGSGEFGAYQFMPGTWDAYSAEYLKSQGKEPQSLVPSQANQDAVAEFKIQQWLNQGWDVRQIAAAWNSGSPTWEGKKGTNKQGVKYDVPSYVSAILKGLPSGGIGSWEPKTDTDWIAKAIMTGEQPPDLKGLYGKSSAVRSTLAKKGYNLTAAQSDWSALQKYTATMNSSKILQLRSSAQTAYDSLDLVKQYSDQLEGLIPRGQYPILNSAAVKAALNGAFGQEAENAASLLETQITDLTSELATVYKGGNSATDDALKLGSTQLSTDWDKERLEKSIDNIRENLNIRINSYKNLGPALPGGGESSYIPGGSSSSDTGLSDDAAYAEYLATLK